MKSCDVCRYGTKVAETVTIKNDAVSIVKWHCAYDNIVHATMQSNCPNFVGFITIFEYLMMTQPQVVHDLLECLGLRIVNDRGRCGFKVIKADVA